MVSQTIRDAVANKLQFATGPYSMMQEELRRSLVDMSPDCLVFLDMAVSTLAHMDWTVEQLTRLSEGLWVEPKEQPLIDLYWELVEDCIYRQRNMALILRLLGHKHVYAYENEERLFVIKSSIARRIAEIIWG